VEGGRWKVEGGRWKVEGGRWKVEGGRWKVEGGRWKVEGGRSQVSGLRSQLSGLRSQSDTCSISSSLNQVVQAVFVQLPPLVGHVWYHTFSGNVPTKEIANPLFWSLPVLPTLWM
jgi:hypothetical protein